MPFFILLLSQNLIRNFMPRKIFSTMNHGQNINLIWFYVVNYAEWSFNNLSNLFI